MDVLNWLNNSFTLPSVIVCLITSFYLLVLDCGYYKRKGYEKEYKVCKFFGVFFIIFGIVMFILIRFVLN